MTYKIEIELADLVGPALDAFVSETEAAVDKIVLAVLHHREKLDITQLLAEHHAIALIWDTDMLLARYPHLTREQAWEVLQACDLSCLAEEGLFWDDVDTVVSELHPKPAARDRHSERVARCNSALQNYPDPDANANLVDLLADARHWCDRRELNFGELDRVAYQHYLAERNGCDSALRSGTGREE